MFYRAHSLNDFYKQIMKRGERMINFVKDSWIQLILIAIGFVIVFKTLLYLKINKIK